MVWEIDLGSPVVGFPIAYTVDGHQYEAVSCRKMRRTVSRRGQMVNHPTASAVR